MMDIITKLQEKILECKKRLKALSTAQTNYIALQEIKVYFANVQDYLNVINNNYSAHINDCSSHTTQIQDLQEQINSINSALENQPSQDVDLSEVTTQIQALNLNLQSCQQQIETLSQDTTINLSLISNDISTIQTELSIINETLSAHNSEIEQINTSIGSINTNISNLTTAQNNLTTSQNNLSSTVTDINNRLSGVENNIDAITGGVDLSELDSRVEMLETNPITTNIVMANKYPMYLNLKQNTPSYSLNYYYKSDNSDFIYQKFIIKYNSLQEGTLTINLLQNNINVGTYEINLNTNPSTYEINYSHFPTNNYQTFQFIFNSTTEVKFEELEAIFWGNNIEFFETDKNLKAICFDNKIYILKYENNKVLEACFDVDDELDLLSSDFIQPQNVENLDIARCVTYGPIMRSLSGVINCVKNCYVIENSLNNKMGLTTITPSTNSIDYSEIDISNISRIYMCDTFSSGISTYIENGMPIICFGSNSGTSKLTIGNLTNFKSGNWYFATPVRENNYINLQSPLRKRDDMIILAYNEDGYLYAINGRQAKSVTRIGKGGKFATGFYQTDGTINVYINKGFNTYKYNLSLNSNNSFISTYIEKIENCDCYYELINQNAIIHTNRGWEAIKY